MPNYRQEGKKSMVSFGVGHRPALDSRIAEMINEGSAKETKKMILILVFSLWFLIAMENLGMKLASLLPNVLCSTSLCVGHTGGPREKKWVLLRAQAGAL